MEDMDVWNIRSIHILEYQHLAKTIAGVNKAMAEDNFELIKYEYNRK